MPFGLLPFARLWTFCVKVNRALGEQKVQRLASLKRLPNQIDAPEKLELQHMLTLVAPDHTATLVLHTSDGKIELDADAATLDAMNAEIEKARLAIFRQQVSKTDKGRGVIKDMMDAAPAPKRIGIALCPETADRLVIYRFPDRMPLTVRVTDEQVQGALRDISNELKRTSN